MSVLHLLFWDLGQQKYLSQNSIWIFGFGISHLEVNERLKDFIFEKESLEDVGDLAVVTQLSNHVVEVGNLIGDVWLVIFMSPQTLGFNSSFLEILTFTQRWIIFAIIIVIDIIVILFMTSLAALYKFTLLRSPNLSSR